MASGRAGYAPVSLDGFCPPDQSRVLEVIDDERLNVKIEFFCGLAFLHTTFRRRVESMRAARAYFPHIKAWLKRMGHYAVFVCIPEGDAMLERFERLFGFSECMRAKGHIIMYQRT